MTARDLALHEGVRLLINPPPGRGDVARLCASNTMSDLIANAGRDTLIVTSLNNGQIVRVAELMDVPAICLVADAAPCAELIQCARAAGTALLVSRLGLEETQKVLEAALLSSKAARP